MKTKIWNVEFGDWTSVNIIAVNAKDAIHKAIAHRRKVGDQYMNRLQDITKVSFKVEAENG